MGQTPAQTGSHDVIIVGAGASGCVLAARLSEIANKRVLLLEAGPEALPGKEHADIRDPFPVSSGNARFSWSGLTAEVSAHPQNATPRTSVRYIQGFGVGGSSNVNGMLADRGCFVDYDEWRDLGATGWGWRDVLPYFKKLEHDRDFAGPLHGRDGPIPIRRVRPDQWAPLTRALANVLVRRGAPLVDDSNGEVRDGVSSVPMNCLPTQRVSASMAYLTEQVRRRPNLRIVANAKVRRLVIRARCVVGVEVETPAGPQMLSGAEVILACGALHSPALLLRSGIGPANQLHALGIEVISDLQAVGQNLQNHPLVTLGVHLAPTARQSAKQRPWQQNQLRYSSKVPRCPEHDMLFLPSNKTAWHQLGRCTAALSVIVLKAYSRGSVELTSPDPAKEPRVRFNLLDDNRDFERLVRGLRMMFEVLDDREVRRMRNEVFVPDEAVVGRLEKRSVVNGFLAWIVAMALSVGPFRRALIKKDILDVGSIVRSEVALQNYVRKSSRAVYHACGTCKMGSLNDPDAVVDSTCRVLGVDSLRVIDASVFPRVPCAGTHLSVLMVAEKMADQIKSEWRAQRSSETLAA